MTIFQCYKYTGQFNRPQLIEAHTILMLPFKVFFLQHASVIEVLLYAFVIILLWSGEIMVCIDTPLEKWRHTKVNVMFIFTALTIQLSLTPFVLAIAKWSIAAHFGLVYFIPGHQNPWVFFISTFLMLDFCEYFYHVVMHKVKLLWKFHLIHHSDHEMDVSTTVREHPVETFIRVCCSIVWVTLSGATLGTLIIRQTFQTVSNLLAHSKIDFPYEIQRVYGILFITPDLHRVHHHYERPHTDSNYGDVLSIWDRIFGTFREMDKNDIIYGIDTHFDVVKDKNFVGILKIPFKKV